VLSACNAPRELTYIPGYELLKGLDFRPYAEKGFLFSPYMYDGKYTTLALIEYVIMPEARLNTYELSDGTVLGKWSKDEIKTEEALDNIYNKCIEFGADAMVDFTLTDNIEIYTGITVPTRIIGVKITGIAIKRED